MNPSRHHRRRHGGTGTLPIRELGEHRPCSTDPPLWDAPVSDNPSDAEKVRLRAAVEVCVTCPQRLKCLEALAGWSHPDGVVAGQVWRDGLRIDVEDWHGTRAGYFRHRRRGQVPCGDCMDANAQESRERRAS